ncbi:MAG TPA: NUDIX hydrolase [Polyangiaceae bacterium]|nr:NUDIX hydrolase [Polyangiaceae bacterium]
MHGPMAPVDPRAEPFPAALPGDLREPREPREQVELAELAELPEAEHHQFELVDDHSEPKGGYLRRLARVLRVVGATGTAGRTFTYDEVDRRGIDAVVVAPYYRKTGQVWVVLRSAHRPPVVLRDASRSPLPEPENRALWELPAGLVEPEEASPEGLLQAAARELEEETGFAVSVDRLIELGKSAFPCPGVIAERQFYFRVEVTPGERRAPSLDGSPLESIGQLVAVPLSVALEAARQGRLADAKTELGLRRLQEALA